MNGGIYDHIFKVSHFLFQRSTKHKQKLFTVLNNFKSVNKKSINQRD